MKSNLINDIDLKLSSNETILFIVYPTQSHYNSFYPLIKKCQNQGFQVIVSGLARHEKSINNNGFSFLKLNYYEHIQLRQCKISFKIFCANLFSKKLLKSRYKDFLIFVGDFKNKIASIHPNKIIIDAHLSSYFIFISKEIEVEVLNTKLSTYKSTCVPPLNNKIIFKRNSFGYRLLAEVLWGKTAIIQIAKGLINKLVFLGKDELFFLNKYLSKENKKFTDYFLEPYKSAFYIDLNIDKLNVKTFIIAPRFLEYRWKKLKENEFYLSFHPSIGYSNLSNWLGLNEFLERYKNDKKYNLQTKLLYCSFGTMTRTRETKIIFFLSKLLQAFSSINNFYIVISSGGILLEKNVLSDKIYINESIPQVDILKVCDIMITHGGMNSIRECCYFNVPMLLYPLDLNFDQLGNAARVEYLGIGFTGNLLRDKPQNILRKTKEVLKIDRSKFLNLSY